MSNSIDTSITKQSGVVQPVDRIELAGETVLTVYEAKTFVSRLRGLHSVWPLAVDEALIIRPCNAIHTMTMKSAIDVVFVNAVGLVLKAESVPRFRFRRCAGACAVIEMREGVIKRLGIVVGDVLVRHRGEWK